MTKYQRALQIWSLLVCAARERRTYRYSDIADVLGLGGAGVVGNMLGPIMYYCQDKGLPPLTVLVVAKDTGVPGEGLKTLEEVNKDRENVFDHDWFSLPPPNVHELEDATKRLGSA